MHSYEINAICTSLYLLILTPQAICVALPVALRLFSFAHLLWASVAKGCRRESTETLGLWEGGKSHCRRGTQAWDGAGWLSECNGEFHDVASDLWRTPCWLAWCRNTKLWCFLLWCVCAPVFNDSNGLTILLSYLIHGSSQAP